MNRRIMVLAAAATLAACGAGAPSAVAPVPTSLNRFKLDYRTSWVLPDAARQRTLAFITDHLKNDVYIFALPSMKLVGTLTGFTGLAGACSDTQGNVWVADQSAIVELSHSGKVLKTLNDTYGFAQGCAVDPATGDLAVTDFLDAKGASGDVLLYPHASGTPTRYTCSGVNQYYFDGFGPGSTLWMNGFTQSGSYVMCGGSPSTLTPLPISGGTPYFPSAVQWDNVHSTWVVFDAFCQNRQGTCSYPVSGSGVLGKPTYYSTYHQGKQICSMGEPAIGGSGNNSVVGGDFEDCGNALTSADRWPYPAGGKPTNYHLFTIDRHTYPFGAAISAI